jgi:hypothetical protein
MAYTIPTPRPAAPRRVSTPTDPEDERATQIAFLFFMASIALAIIGGLVALALV